MNSALVRKLGSFAPLPAEDVAFLDEMAASWKPHKAGSVLIEEGDRPDGVFLLIEGWAYRYKLLPDGSRQIMAYLLPGDVCDIHIFILREMDHSIGLLSDAKVVDIPKAVMSKILDQRPSIARALFWATLVDEAILREWLVNMGQRDAFARLAHLFYELWLRLDLVGLARQTEFTLPLTQEQLGDTMGLTQVHVSRVMQRLREEELISFQRGATVIKNPARLKEIASFDPNYLHLQKQR